MLGAETRVIGERGGLPWRLPHDLRRFSDRTNGHPVIMGRKTWQSLPGRFRPLPGRTNIIVSGDSAFDAPGGFVVPTFAEALERAEKSPGVGLVFVIGGAQLYEQALPYADRLYLTLVESKTSGDTYFPPYEDTFYELSREAGPRSADEPPYFWTEWRRK